MILRSVWLGCLAAIVWGSTGWSGSPWVAEACGQVVSDRQTQNVILITIDGLRWQEVFRGAEERLISESDGGVKDVPATKEAFWRSEIVDRRRTLMPFVWDVIARDGQLLGNRDRGSQARVLNNQHFSYPGYQEVLCGYPDERVTSNDKIPNANITVLEWLSRRPEIGPRVAIFGSWDTFPAIINDQRSGLPINAGWQPLEVARDPQTLVEINRLTSELPRTWPGVRYDAITAWGAREFFLVKHPRLLYLALGEPGDWAHEGRYDQYLAATQRCDRLIADLWQTAQSLPEYAGQTTLVLTVDHGRGRDGDGWKNHSTSIPGSDEIWIGVLGPDTPAAGDRQGVTATQSQVAATVAALLGADYRAAVPQAGEILPGVIK
ncbi:MAG: hypothetical protein U0795_04820 [Pirellulales bacterium]